MHQVPTHPVDACVELHKPGLVQCLRALRLDVTYHRASGNRLYYTDPSSGETEVLDFVGGYGALLLGHAHPAIVKAAQAFWSNARPNLAQGTMRPESERLAKALSHRIGGEHCAVFSNSGAEAVEIAIKHALLETGGRTFLSLDGGFHGKTLGALQLTANPNYRDPFALPSLSVRRIKPNCLTDLQQAFSAATSLAGFIYEPIQGEAGIRPLEQAFLRRAAELCREHDIPLIADECQTGMGRTGKFLASEWYGVTPDYIILSKSLGGGVAKIAATLIHRNRYRCEFDILHTSTFADDEYSSTMARITLEQLHPALLRHCQDFGSWLKSELETLVGRYPRWLREVRGQGLLLGLEFHEHPDAQSFSIRYWAAHGMLGSLVSAYLLRQHQIRVAPSLSDPLTLRLQPAAVTTYADGLKLLRAIDDVCQRLEQEDVVGLTRFLVESDAADFVVPRIHSQTPARVRHSVSAADVAALPADTRHVAWLFHLVDQSDAVHLDPQLRHLTPSERTRYIDRLASIAEPVLMDDIDVQSTTHRHVRITPILLPVTSHWMKRLLQRRQLGALRNLVQRGVTVAEAIGCDIAALGQFTSIVTRNGRSLSTNGMHLVTGNSYTAGLVAEAVMAKLSSLQRDASHETCAIIGAAGNIGSACIDLLAPHFARTLLIGSGKPSTAIRLQAFADQYDSVIVSQPDELRDADVVVCATNAIDVLLQPHLFKTDAIVSDVSVPSMIPDTALRGRPDVHWIPGGTVRLPMGESMTIPGFPLEAGFIYGCMAEAMLLGFEPTAGKSLIGPVQIDHVRGLQSLAYKHGLAHPETLAGTIATRD